MKTRDKVVQIRHIICFFLLSLVLISCSEDDEDKNMAFGHSHPEATDMEKHLFEHEFAQQCIAQKTALSGNKDSEQFAEPCMCIATHLLKDLAAKESYKLLYDKEHSKSLKIKYHEAVEKCLN